MHLNYIDYIIIGIIFIFGLRGFKAGFIFSIMSFFRYIICLGAISLYYPYIFQYIIQNEKIFYLFTNISSKITGNPNVSAYFIRIVVQIFCILFIFVVSNILLKFILTILQKAFEIPPLNIINKFLGFFIGCLKGFIIIFLLVIVSHPILKIVNNDMLIQDLNKSLLVKYMYMYNFLFKYFDDFIEIFNNYSKSSVI